VGELWDVVRLVAIGAIIFYVLTRLPAVRAVIKYWDQFEPVQRRRAVWTILTPRPGATVMRRRAMAGVPAELTHPAQAEVVRDIDPRADSAWLLVDRTRLADASEGMQAFDLDPHGSALMGHAVSGGPACTLEIRLRDQRVVPLVHARASGEARVFDASFGDSHVAWWQARRSSDTLDLWRWAPESGARVVAHVPFPHAAHHTSVGRVTVAGDVAVVTYAQQDESYRAVAVRLTDGVVADLGVVAFPTVFVDLGAATVGRHAVTLVRAVPHVAFGDLSLVDTETWPPTVTPLRRGAFPGASAYLGGPVAWWRDQRLIELPGRVHLRTPPGVMAHEVLFDGAWLTAMWRTTVDAVRLTWTTQGMAIHPATGAVVEVSPHVYGPVLMRGEWAMWRDATPESIGYPEGSHSTWVGRLLDPSTTPGPRDA